MCTEQCLTENPLPGTRGGKPLSQLLSHQRPIREVAMETDSLLVLCPLSQMYTNAS